MNSKQHNNSNICILFNPYWQSRLVVFTIPKYSTSLFRFIYSLLSLILINDIVKMFVLSPVHNTK